MGFAHGADFDVNDADISRERRVYRGPSPYVSRLAARHDCTATSLPARLIQIVDRLRGHGGDRRPRQRSDFFHLLHGHVGGDRTHARRCAAFDGGTDELGECDKRSSQKGRGDERFDERESTLHGPDPCNAGSASEC